MTEISKGLHLLRKARINAAKALLSRFDVLTLKYSYCFFIAPQRLIRG